MTTFALEDKKMKLFINDIRKFNQIFGSTIKSVGKTETPLISLLTRIKDYNQIWSLLNESSLLTKTTIIGQTVWMTGKVRITLDKISYV